MAPEKKADSTNLGASNNTVEGKVEVPLGLISMYEDLARKRVANEQAAGRKCEFAAELRQIIEVHAELAAFAERKQLEESPKWSVSPDLLAAVQAIWSAWTAKETPNTVKATKTGKVTKPRFSEGWSGPLPPQGITADASARSYSVVLDAEPLRAGELIKMSDGRTIRIPPHMDGMPCDMGTIQSLLAQSEKSRKQDVMPKTSAADRMCQAAKEFAATGIQPSLDFDASECLVGVKLPPGLKPPKGWEKKAFAGKKLGELTSDMIIDAATAAMSAAAEAQAENERQIPCRLCIRLTEPATHSNDWNVEVGVVFANDPSVLIKTESQLFSQLSTARRDTASATLSQKLPLASRLWVPLRRVGRNNGRKTATTDEVLELIQNTTAKLHELDVEVQLPSCLEKDTKARRVVVRCSVGEWNGEDGAGLSAKVLLSARLELAVDGVPLTAEELERVAQLKQPLVRLRGKWFYFDPEEWGTGELKRIVERAQSGARQTELAGTLVRDAMFGRIGSTSIPFEFTTSNSRDQEFVDRLIQKADVPLVELPRGLKAELRPYQHVGYSWLSFLSDYGLGACLADDMGLGKTLQTLTWLLRAKEQHCDKPSLLICPTSVMRNWQDECENFSPSLRIYEHHGTNRLDQSLALFAQAQNHDVVITTYNVLQRDLELFTTISWHAVILDEAQNIKNHSTQQSRAVREPKLTAGTSFRLALTGTPIENHVGDLWPIMDFLNPGLLGNWTQFERKFVTPIRNNRDAETRESLKRIIQPFVLRRMKSDPKIAPELPEKLESIEWCSLTREQAEWYRAVLNELEEKANAPDRLKRQSAVLNVLLKLKQTCNHPALLVKDRSQLGARSGKLNRLVEMLDEVLDNDEKALIFTQYAEMAAMLEDFLGDHFRVGTNVLSGECSVEKRKEIVKTFQEDARFPILILTLKAGGVGLNLTAANHVFHFDRWWNPAVEDQATDRAYRIGQKKTVNVHKFVCIGTLEERIAQMLDEKRSLSKDLLGEASDESLAGYLSKLDVAELRSFLRLDDRAIGDE